MGAGFVILIWLVLAAIYAVGFLALVGFWFWARKHQKKWLQRMAGMLATGMAALALFVLAWVTYLILDFRNPRSVFKREFGTRPPESISEIQSSFWRFGDSETAYLRFKTTREAFDKLVPAGLQRRTADEMEREIPGESDEPPAWWVHKIGANWICYLQTSPGTSPQRSKGFSNETEYFVFNPEMHIAYYHYIGID